MIKVHALWEGRGRKVASMLVLALFLSRLATSQDGQEQSQIPDAPSASRPAQFPGSTAPAPKNPEQKSPASNETAPNSGDDEPSPLPPPPAAVADAPNGGGTGTGETNSRADFVIPVNVSLVVVPVTVKDPTGRLVD